MRGCSIAFVTKIYNQLKAELNSERKKDSPCKHSPMTSALIDLLYDIWKEEFNDV